MKLKISIIVFALLFAFGCENPETNTNQYEVLFTSTSDNNSVSINFQDVFLDFAEYDCGVYFYYSWQQYGVAYREIIVKTQNNAQINLTVKRNNKVLFDETASGHRVELVYRDSI